MANSDKNIVITPNISQTAQPNVVFTGQGNVPITLKVLDDSYGTLSFEGSAGQLFSINNNLTSGIIFSVNDVSGIPQIDVNADGTIRIAPFGSNLQIAGLIIGKGGSGVSSNTAFGFSALAANTTGAQNTAFGYEAAAQTTTGSDIVAIGWRALKNPTGATSSTAVGANALAAVTTATSNTAVGRYAGYQLTTGSANTILGGAMYGATSAFYNVAVGHQALQLLSTGATNTSVGYQAGYSVTGSNNTILGSQSGSGITSGGYNTTLGTLALSNANGSDNVVVGALAARFQADGTTTLTATSSSVYIGYGSRGFNNSDTNSIVIGSNAIGKGANTTVLGNTSTTQTWLYGSNRLPFNSASGLSTFSVGKTILGGVHFVNGAGTNTSTRNEAAITFQGSADTEAQAGIYVTNDNSTGTHMAFATTDSYATGPQLAITISNTGVVNFPRAIPTYAGTAITYGTGTANYVTKYTGTSSQGSSQIFDNGTNVGIGTASPGAKLEIQTADGADSLAMSGYKVMKWESSNHLVYGGYTAGQWQILKFFTNGSERFRVDASGNFGIGNTSPGARLQVDTGATGTTGLIVKGFTGQTAALSTWQNSSGNVLDFIAADGSTSFAYGDITWTPNYSGGVTSPSTGTFQKTSGNTAWDGQVYSSEGFVNNVYVSFKLSQTNAYLMFGLNNDPATSAHHNSIDYAWYTNGGNLEIYENGTQIGGNNFGGAYTTNTLIAIAYDGTNVTYYKDGVIIRQVARAIGNPLYLDSSFNSLNGAVNSVRFGPMSPNCGMFGTANYIPKFGTNNYLTNSSLQDTATGVVINSVATPRYYSYSVTAGNAVRLGQWNVTEGNVALHIQVSSDTGGHSGTSSYLYQGGFNVISNTSGQYIKLMPLMIGRGHGDGPDNSISSDSGGWTVFLYTGTTSAAYTMGVAVGVPTGKANKTLRITITELRGGMTYTADGSSISYPTTSSPGAYQHTYGNLYSNGPIQSAYGPYLGASGYVSGGFIGISKWLGMDGQYVNIRKLYGTRVLPTTVGNYIEIARTSRYGSSPVTITIHANTASGLTGQAAKIYQFCTEGFNYGLGTVPPVSSYVLAGGSGNFDFELEAVLDPTNSNFLTFRIRRTVGTANADCMFSIEMHNYNSSALLEASNTGTSSAALSYINTNNTFTTIKTPGPAGGSGNGVNLNILAGSGVTSGAGGSIILQPGAQATTGGNGTINFNNTSGGTVAKLSTDSSYLTITPQTSQGFRIINSTTSTVFAVTNGLPSVPAGLDFNNQAAANVGSIYKSGYAQMLVINPKLQWPTNTPTSAIESGSTGQIKVTDGSTGGGSFAFTSSTAAYSADQNNLALSGSAFQRLSAAGGVNRTITGIAPPSGGTHVDGRMMRIYNIGTANNIILAHNSTSSTDVNRLFCVGQANITLGPFDYAELIYDASDNGRGGAGWRVH